MTDESITGVELEGRIAKLDYACKLVEFAALVEAQQVERLKADGFTLELHLPNAKAVVKRGKKYAKVDVGSSGKFMVDEQGNIFGIKAYGVVHKGHRYGTLDTTAEYFWGGYQPVRRVR